MSSVSAESIFAAILAHLSRIGVDLRKLVGQLKNGIYSFPAWRSAFMGGCGEQAGKFACCVLGQGT